MHPLPPFGDPTRPEAQAETYAEARISGRTPQEAARIADYRGKRAERPLKFIETHEMRARMQRALLRIGAGPKKIGETVLNAMDATTTTRDGDIVPDHRARILGARLAKEIIMPEDRAAAQGATTITINLPGPAAEMYARFVGAQTIEGEK